MKHTPLFEKHLETAHKVINLKGFARPIEYYGHKTEHQATREGVTICDVSHMGEIEFIGKDALRLIQKLMTNDASRLNTNQALYSVMCNENGGIIDDFICYKLGEEHYLWVVNVTKVDEDFEWILKHAQGLDVKVRDITNETALIAVQGPLSRAVLQKVVKANLSEMKYFYSSTTKFYAGDLEIDCLISRTGYTGEHGYEVMVPREYAPYIWDELLLVGKPLGIMPHGVAARESLRLEAGLHLNGNDMNEHLNPYEVGLSWLVKMNKESFIGKTALEKVKDNGVNKKLVGFEILGKETVRHGDPITVEGNEIGYITSGPITSRFIGKDVGMGILDIQYSTIGTEVNVTVNGKSVNAKVIGLPFYKHKANEEPATKTFPPYELKYLHSHVWVHQDSDSMVTIGVSDFGQRDMGEFLFIDLPAVGAKIEKDNTIISCETYRKRWEFNLPFSGEVINTNKELLESPDLINKYPYHVSGILQLKVDNTNELENAMNLEEYNDHVIKLMRYANWSKDVRRT